jgi:Leucine-rich repeat (LRR) protein
MNLPSTAYNPNDLKRIDEVVTAAGKIIAANNATTANKPGHNTPTTLGVIATEAVQANQEKSHEQQNIAFEHEQKTAELNQKIYRLAEQVFSGLASTNPTKQARMAGFVGQFTVQPAYNGSSEQVIKYYDDEKLAETTLWLSGRGIKGSLAIPAELQVTSLVCRDNFVTDITELPNTLSSLDISDNRLTSLPPLPPNLSKLFATSNKLTTMPAALPKPLKVGDLRGNNFQAAIKSMLKSRNIET